MVKFEENGTAVFTGRVVALNCGYEIKATEFQMNVNFVLDGDEEFPENTKEKHGILGPKDLILDEETTIIFTPADTENGLHIKDLIIDKFDQTCIYLVDNAFDAKLLVDVMFKTGVPIPKVYRQLNKHFNIFTN